MKTCSVCWTEKTLSSFHKRTAAKDGRQNRCKQCAIAITAKWQKEHAAQTNEKNRRWTNGPNRDAIRANANANAHRIRANATPEWRENRRVVERRYWLKARYGLTSEEYDRLWELQDGRCAICGKSPGGRKKYLDVDHDHMCCPTSARSCGKCVRGLLCSGCNTAIGVLHSSDLLSRAVTYLSLDR